MPKKREFLKTSQIPETVVFLFENPPVMNNEEAALYGHILEELIQEVRPGSYVEWIWVKDIADHTLSIIRMRRWMVQLIRISTKEAVKSLLTGVCDKNLHNADAWFDDDGGRADVLAQLGQYGLTEESVAAKAWDIFGDKHMRAERMLASFVAERNRALENIKLNQRREMAAKAEKASDRLIKEQIPLVPSG